jgi:NAD(P)-dependent dehydrogenase (short-subunit alcohol dehydrogenase family)
VRLLTPLRRFGDPLKDAGGLAVFLSGEQSAYMTGMNFMLDGGRCLLP